MYYVELLRVGRALRTGAIALAAVLLLNIVLFFAAHGTVPQSFRLPIEVVWAFTGFVTSIFASVLGNSLALENDGHLPLAWTKPVSKPVHALTKMSVDLAAVAAMFVMTCAAVFAYFAVIGGLHSVVTTTDSNGLLVRFLIGPVAFYGLMQALTSGLARPAGLVIGLTWVACFVLVTLQISKLPPALHAVIDFISYANPMVYVAFGMDTSGVVVPFGLATAVTGLALIAILGNALAIVRWQRVEA